MKYLKLFEDMYNLMPRPTCYVINNQDFTSNNLDYIENKLWTYVSKFYVSKTSFGKKFINDFNGDLILEITAKGKYAMTKFGYFVPYLKDEEGKYAPTTRENEKLLLKLLHKKFPNIQIDGVIFEEQNRLPS